MKRSKIIKSLTSLMLGTTILLGGMASSALAAENSTKENENKVATVWDSKDYLVQNNRIPYQVGDIVIYGSSQYQCKRFHYAQSGWNPSDAPMFWRLVCTIPKWNVQEELTQVNKTPYKKGDMVMHNSKVYKCKRFHYAQPGWNPSDAKMFWKLVK